MSTPDQRPRRLTLPTRLLGPSLLVVSTILFIAALAGTLYTLEQAYYNPRKWEVISQKIQANQYFDQTLASEMSYAAEQLVLQRSQGRTGPQMDAIYRQAGEAIENLVEATDHITAITIVDGDSEEVILSVERRDRLRTQHDFSNSLLTRNFERAARQSLLRRQGNVALAVLHVYVTTARGDPDIEAVTSYYRWTMIGGVLVITLTYWGLLYYVLLPVTRVISSMQGREGSESPIIDDPRSLLERVYNLLARDATLTRFSKELRDLISSTGVSHADPVLEEVPGLVRRITGVEGCQVWTFGRRVSTSMWELEHVHTLPGEEERARRMQTELLRRIAESDPVEHPRDWSAAVIPALGGKDVSRQVLCDLLRVTPDRFSLLLIVSPPGASALTQWKLDFYTRIPTELRFALSSVEDQRRFILQEKSKANISLSRNLGHDLTNIIATSKLELMTIQAFLSLPPEEVKSSPAKADIFRESLGALLNNTRFLQEIVNLYRSFSYLQKPKFEEAEIAELVRDSVNLYRLSLSRNIEIRSELPEKLAMARVEPRLLRLAIFNLLNNATDAIKRATSPENPNGLIKVRARLRPKKGDVDISVEDTGTGIRDEEGNLLKQDAIAEIFRLGYSTKKEQEGEGLGLNWVQTIVREFHGGDVIAYNRKEGGACFAIRLPLESSLELPAAGHGAATGATTRAKEATHSQP